ncbi:class I lanthipeptide [Chitinophaga qingshengii]|uniref:Class I lanthipeptide n=1 Tax=Chitinophaga qingshengii TaxID=1569794 RepID=A0ABR7TSU9_9BACT|nr:class I lanthipeptide [Chitinophaga qingshengii]MBC9933527.1 class I lanthipeptide [Chitinophaga qingshengii]
MKKKKLHLPKLSLSKEVISNLSQERIVGGATVREFTCIQTCRNTCYCSLRLDGCVTADRTCRYAAD